MTTFIYRFPNKSSTITVVTRLASLRRKEIAIAAIAQRFVPSSLAYPTSFDVFFRSAAVANEGCTLEKSIQEQRATFGETFPHILLDE